MLMFGILFLFGVWLAMEDFPSGRVFCIEIEIKLTINIY